MLNLQFSFLLLAITVSGHFAVAQRSLNELRHLRTIQPKSLREAVLLTIELNPKTRAKDLLIQAQHETTLGVKAQMYPSGSFGCGTSLSPGRTVIDNNPMDSRQSTINCNLSGSVTLWDGGVGRYNYKAAIKTEEAVAQRLKSTSPFVHNGKGSLANAAMMAYMSLVMNQSILKETERNIVFLQKFLAVTTNPDEQSLIAAKLYALNRYYTKTDSHYRQAQKQFRYVVTTDPGTPLESLEETIVNVRIPATPQEAFLISLEKNPDVKSTEASLQAEEYTLKAAKAAAGINVSLVGNLNGGQSHEALNGPYDFRSTSGSVGIQARIPLSFSRGHYTKAQKLRKESARSERDSALDDAKYGIESTYDELEAEVVLHGLATQGYNDSLRIVEATIEKIENHDPSLPSTQTFLSQYANLSENFGILIGAQATMLTLRFSIQQLAGTVFDQVQDGIR